MLTSYNGWPASQDPKAIGINQAWEPIAGHRFPGGVKAGDVETVLTYVVRQLDAHVEPIDRDAIKDEWGWHYKPSANSPDTLSCHSSGTAFDYNATRHPNGHRGTFTPTQVRAIRVILADVGVVRWLGDATRVADEMHFEIHGTPAQVAVAAARLRAPKPKPDQKDRLMLRIATVKGEPTAAGNQTDLSEKYRVLSASDKSGNVFDVEAWHLTQAEYDVWRYVGLDEDPKVIPAKNWHGLGIPVHGGSFAQAGR